MVEVACQLISRGCWIALVANPPWSPRRFSYSRGMRIRPGRRPSIRRPVGDRGASAGPGAHGRFAWGEVNDQYLAGDTGQREHEVELTGYVNPGRTGTAFLPRAGKRRWRWVAAHCCGTGNDRGLGHIDFLAASRDRRGGSQCVLPVPAGTDHSDALYSTTIAPVEDRCNPPCVASLW